MKPAKKRRDTTRLAKRMHIRYWLGRGNTVLFENGDICLQSTGGLWHKLTDEGPEFKCRECGRLEVVTWDDIRQTITILAQHPGETWSLLCVCEKSLMLAAPSFKPDTKHDRLVSLTLENGTLIFTS